ncbi:MAG TPA: response regulator transcription factor [Candidatus Acidoferrales bacterium]|jgi:two-component system response regulator NreC|nr:response regulator transcription factor [Candidatus Acidoferrales bacterium]
MSLRILLADDHAIVRDGMKSFLQSEGCTVVGEASNGQDAVTLAGKLRPDVAVLDLTMPLLNGVDAAQAIRQVAPDTKTIVVTQHKEDHFVVEALRAGAVGYVLKTHAARDLLQAVREVLQGNIYLSPGISGAVVHAMLNGDGKPKEVLTPRERQVLQLIAEGKSTKEVAVQIGVSTKTGESHRARLMEKLDIHQTAGLVRYAIRHGLIQA